MMLESKRFGPSVSELNVRIRESLKKTDSTELELVSTAWGGYLVGMLECGYLTVDEHSSLNDLLVFSNKKVVTDIILPDE